MRSACVSLAALVALAGCAAARVPSPYPGAPVVRGVAIDGVREVGADVIRARIGTVATGRWPWDPPRRFDPVIWEEDLARIPRILESEGFFQGRVVSHEVLERRDGVVPRAVVEEGPPTVVAEVELRGLDGLPDGMRAQARAAVTLRRGERFREADWTATRSALEEVLRAGGYAEARLAAEARVHPESRAARALIEVLPGPRYRFGDLRVVTPVPPGIPQEAIVAEASSAARPGAWYDPRALAEAQARVYRMGAFSAVEVSEEAPDPRSRTVPVVIAVRAGPTRTASAGVGVGLSPHLDDVHATADWVERPSAGGLRTLRVRARAGIGAVPPFPTALSAAGSPPTRAEPFASLAADVDAPWELAASTGLHLFSSLELDLGLDEAYRSATLRPSAGVAWNPRPALQLEAQYRFSVARLFDTPLSSDPARPEVFGCATPCPISALDLLATLDTHRLSRPDSGGRRVRLRLRGAGGPLGGGYDFVQAVASLEGDRPVSPDERIRLAARLEVGTVVADGAVPVTERLAGGGRQRVVLLGELQLGDGEQLAVLVGGGA